MNDNEILKIVMYEFNYRTNRYEPILSNGEMVWDCSYGQDLQEFIDKNGQIYEELYDNHSNIIGYRIID